MIKQMRSRVVAPVDTMGCDQAQRNEEDPRVCMARVSPLISDSLTCYGQNRRFSTLISLMLSSQTKDEVTDAAVSTLRTALGGSLTVEGVINADKTVISEAIQKVGFWRRKTEYVNTIFTLPCAY